LGDLAAREQAHCCYSELVFFPEKNKNKRGGGGNILEKCPVD